jgi:hypothetical protein
LDVVSFGDSAVADEAAGDSGEGKEVLGLAFVAAVQRRQPPSRDIVRSIVQRCRPSRVEDSSLAGDAVRDASLAQPAAPGEGLHVVVGNSCWHSRPASHDLSDAAAAIAG